MKTLYILDAYSLMYTSYFAGFRTGLSSPSGEPTYGTFIFVKTILRILEEYSPDLICIAIDGPAKNLRKEVYKEYKNNRRKEMPEDLPVQVDRMKQILEVMDFPVYYAPGYEADDVIATIVEKAPKDFLITIVSKDKDLNQLIDNEDRINVFDPYRDSRKYYDDVREKYGINPYQFLDYQGLVGDPTDNIPGVKGIGPKTAVKLLQEYLLGDRIFECVSTKEKLSKTDLKLLEGYDSFVLSRKLATLRTDIDMDINFEDMERKEIDWAELNKIFEELDFDSLIKDTNGHRELI